MSSDRTSSNPDVATTLRSTIVTISPWVIRADPRFARNFMRARRGAIDAATPGWILYGLALIGRFPRKRRYRGRPIGWQRLEVILDWLTKGLEAANDDDFNQPSQMRRASLKHHPRQGRLPLECGTQCALAAQCTSFARKVVAQSQIVPKTRATGAPRSPEHGHE